MSGDSHGLSPPSVLSELRLGKRWSGCGCVPRGESWNVPKHRMVSELHEGWPPGGRQHALLALGPGSSPTPKASRDAKEVISAKI